MVFGVRRLVAAFFSPPAKNICWPDPFCQNNQRHPSSAQRQHAVALSVRPSSYSVGKRHVWKLYPYVGPTHLAKQANTETPRLRVHNAAKLAAWVAEQPSTEADGTLTVTFVVMPDGLWVADRHSEHVACARGGPVHSAGEMTFAVDKLRLAVQVVHVTNQSTGFCPEPESWPALEAALDAAGISHPDGFSVKMIFRRCPKCGATNIVKDEWFECALCRGALPSEWNYGGLAGHH